MPKVKHNNPNLSLSAQLKIKADESSLAARSRAARMGCDPVDSIEFSRMLGQADNYVTRVRSRIAGGHPDAPPLGPPEPTWNVGSEKKPRPVWARSVCLAFAKAKEARAKTFKMPRLNFPIELTPITAAGVAEICDVEPDTVMQWRDRGILPVATWVVGQSDAWARGVIEDWNNARVAAGITRAAASPVTQGRVARMLVSALNDQGLLAVDDRSGEVRVSEATVTMPDPDDAVVLRSI